MEKSYTESPSENENRKGWRQKPMRYIKTMSEREKGATNCTAFRGADVTLCQTQADNKPD